MSRETDGKYKEGFSGNPNGRPVETSTAPSLDQWQKGYLRLLAEKHPVPVNGKKKRMSCREIIQRQLLTLAMQGEPRALFKVHEIEEDIVTARWKSQIRLLEEILKMERSLRENPESVSEGKLEALKSARRELADFDKLD